MIPNPTPCNIPKVNESWPILLMNMVEKDPKKNMVAPINPAVLNDIPDFDIMLRITPEIKQVTFITC